MKKVLCHILGSLAIAALCFHLSHAAGAKFISVTPSSVDEGDSPIPFNVGCASTTWTVLVASDSIRRSLVAQTGASNAGGVCVSTGPAASAVACGDTTKGIELSSAAWNDGGHAAWFCRSRPGASTGTLQGYISRDRGDYGYIAQ